MIGQTLIALALFDAEPNVQFEPLRFVYVEQYEPTRAVLFDRTDGRAFRFEDELRVGVRFRVRF